jgi:hypothetical protein
MRFLFVRLFLATLFLASASHSGAGELSSLELSAQPTKLLDDRLRISMPEGAKIKQRQRDIMSAEESIEEETRVVFEKGQKKLVLMVYETFQTAGGDFETEIKKMERRMTAEGQSAQTVLLIRTDDFRVFQTTVTPIDTNREAIVICSAWVVNKDHTVQVLHAYANPEAAKDLDDVKDLYDRVLKTIRPGNKRLNAQAKTQELDVGSKARQLALDLPDGYIATVQRGPDFLVHEVHQIVPFGSPSPSLGIYVGGHPSYHHKQYDKSNTEVEEIEGELIGKKVKWFQISEEGLFFMETIRPAKEIDDWLQSEMGIDDWPPSETGIEAYHQLHVFFSAPTEEKLATVKKMVETMRFIDVKGTPKTDREQADPH